MSKKEFLAQAKPIAVSINGIPMVANPHKFSTTSVGFQTTGKVPVQLPDGTIHKLQIGLNATIIGSKEWAEGDETAAA